MRISASPLRTAAIVAALAILPAGAQPRKKQVKDQREQDLYNQAIHAEDPAAQIQALGAWTARYPQSDFKDDRLYFYMQAYSRVNPPQPAKVVEYGAPLVQRDLRSVFPGPEGGLVALNVLFLTVQNVAGMDQPSGEQLALGQKAARDLLQMLASYKPPNTADAEWTAARSEIEQRTRSAITSMALAPGNQAMQKSPPDCTAAATAYSKAVEQFPENAATAHSLGKALHCNGRISEAIFQFVRAGQIEPGELSDYAAKLYTAYHGTAAGFDAVQALARRSHMPPADFRIETASEGAQRNQSEFAREFPHLSRWYAVREQLAAPYGAQYFEGQMKGEAISLRGSIGEVRPACRPKELLVAIGPGARAEISIRLDTPPAGTAVPGEIDFTAVPRAFSKDPLLVTMDAHRAKIENLKIGPCPQP